MTKKKQEGTKTLDTIPDGEVVSELPTPTHQPIKIENAKLTKAGNIDKRSISTTIGRPTLFKSADEVETIIEDYFDWCDNRVTSVYVKELGDNIPIANPAPYTMSGLARRLGMDRKSLLNYSKKAEFFPTIKAARQRIEEDVEMRLMEGKNQAGAIFNLKNNFGYVDKVENEMSIKEMPKPIIDLGIQPPQQELDDGETTD